MGPVIGFKAHLHFPLAGPIEHNSDKTEVCSMGLWKQCIIDQNKIV